jgi:CubicO group peptidase (beta-lactamase class C family)
MQRFATRVAVILFAALSAGCTSQPSQFRTDLGSFIERLRSSPHAPPGFVVVAVDRNQSVFEGAYGVRDVSSGVAMSLDTPIYNASVTKAYTGVLAAVLDARGELPLSTSLHDVWPDLTLPAGLDPAAITVSRLLSHSSELSAGGLIYKSVVTGEVAAKDVPAHLQAFARRGAPGFVYSNLGPFVYSAMVEHKTGLAWRDSLARNVLEPMGLLKTSARLEDVAAEVAHCHYWKDGEWHSAPSKPTPVLNAAGGMYASGRDSARFLQAFLSDDAVLARTWRPVVEQNRDFLGMHRDGYGLGWDLGTYDDHRFVSRSGGYTGCRALILFLPKEQFGIAVLSVGDTGVNEFDAAIVRQAIDYWVQSPQAEQRAGERFAEYEHAAAAEFARLPARLGPSQPVASELARALVGAYENERLGRLSLTQESDALVLRAGLWTAELHYQGGLDFTAVERGTDTRTAVALYRDGSGRVPALVLDDDRFDRVATPSTPASPSVGTTPAGSAPAPLPHAQ